MDLYNTAQIYRATVDAERLNSSNGSQTQCSAFLANIDENRYSEISWSNISFTTMVSEYIARLQEHCVQHGQGLF
ncbi:hypothetical protein Tsubulata_041214 [Turnera subulata]|uniref:Uncharacterized protein n=1 Tax=Turnera subulata TaxID=218843 RepID=A0A9Q0GF91_9ROSI|nr:hypothetical protein Tsubulata_041214 [Turnera subulata]